MRFCYHIDKEHRVNLQHANHLLAQLE